MELIRLCFTKKPDLLDADVASSRTIRSSKRVFEQTKPASRNPKLQNDCEDIDDPTSLRQRDVSDITLICRAQGAGMLDSIWIAIHRLLSFGMLRIFIRSWLLNGLDVIHLCPDVPDF